MPRRLVLHIGYYKTGTTSLQDHLGHLRPVLEERGILYPRAGRPVRGDPSHGALSIQELQRAGARLPRWYTRRSKLRRYLTGTAGNARNALAAEIAASDSETVIVSSEEFVRFGDDRGVPAEQARAMLGALGVEQTTVVCYVRRPDRYLESWYNQLVKMGRPVARLSPVMRRKPLPRHPYYGSPHTDFDRMLEYWADVVGRDQLVVRDYDHLRNGAILDDFSAAAGVPDLGDLEVPPVRPNLRIDNNFIEYARMWSLYRPGHDHKPLHALLARMAEDPKLPPRFDVYVLDPGARRRLHRYVSPVNERLGKLAGRPDGFFPDLDDMLTVPKRSTSDIEAFRFWAPYIDVAVRASGIA
jgi:hypothetical protein